MSELNADNSGPESTQTNETDVTSTDTAENGPDTPDGNSDTFTREYVEGLRKENATARAKVKEVENLARTVHTALVVADGRLVDPAALEYREEHLTDPEALKAAVAALIDAKPYLRAKPVSGDAGQGNRGGTASGPTSFADLLRG